jgi:fumarate hydratase subunit beta
MIKIHLPVSEAEIRKLKMGDEVSLNGIMLTGRDSAHTWLLEEKQEDVKDLLKGSVIYHCGPVVKKENDEWHFVAAGPTTSIREEPYQGSVIKEYGIRGVMGKGGMGEKTLKALGENGSVYLHAVGGAATLQGQAVKKVHGVVKLEEFGVPEALWIIEVEDFQAVVTMDSHGNSLHKDIKESSDKVANELIGI